MVKEERQPQTSTEEYGKLLYDVYNNGKRSLTTTEANLIQDQTQLIVHDALQNIAGIKPSDEAAIASGVIANIINIGYGIISYNSPNPT